MPWKEADLVKIKYEFILKSFNKDKTFTELCRDYGISTKTGYKWKQRFLEGGLPALEELPRRPVDNGNKIPEEISVELIRIKNIHKSWGASKILQVYKNNIPGSIHQLEVLLKISSSVPDSPSQRNASETKPPTEYRLKLFLNGQTRSGLLISRDGGTPNIKKNVNP